MLFPNTLYMSKRSGTVYAEESLLSGASTSVHYFEDARGFGGEELCTVGVQFNSGVPHGGGLERCNGTAGWVNSRYRTRQSDSTISMLTVINDAFRNERLIKLHDEIQSADRKTAAARKAVMELEYGPGIGADMYEQEEKEEKVDGQWAEEWS